MRVRGVIALSAVVVIACSESYGDANAPAAGAGVLQIPMTAKGDGGRLVISPNVADVGDVRYVSGTY